MDCKHLCVLIVVAFLYMAAGTIMFSFLELENEQKNRAILRGKLINFVANHTCIEMSDLLHLLKLVESQSHHGMRMAKSIIINGTNPDRWSYTGSLSFVVTVVTTIGYGHLSPDTTISKIVSVVYALFGIPLTLVMLKEIGEKLSHASKRLHKVHFCDKAWINRTLGVTIVILVSLTLVMLLPSLMFVHVEGWTMVEALYYCFITLSTIGFGDYLPAAASLGGTSYYHPYLVFIYVWVLFGLVHVSLFITSISNAMVNKARIVEQHTITKLEAEMKRLKLEMSKHRRNTCYFNKTSDETTADTPSQNATLLRFHTYKNSLSYETAKFHNVETRINSAPNDKDPNSKREKDISKEEQCSCVDYKTDIASAPIEQEVTKTKNRQENIDDRNGCVLVRFAGEVDKMTH